MSTVTRMFPLGMVLYPGVGLPLRVFEPRYRRLTRECLDAGDEFGIVLISKGRDIGGDDERFDVGTNARIVDAQVDEEGQGQIIVVGTERFRIDRWLDDSPYPRAVTETFTDYSSPDSARLASVTKRVRRMLAQRTELNLPTPAPSTVEFADDPTTALWQLCAVMPTPVLDDLALLSTNTATARIELLESLLDGVEADLAKRLS